MFLGMSSCVILNFLFGKTQMKRLIVIIDRLNCLGLINVNYKI